MIDYRAVAKNFIKPYVEKGSAESFLRDMGSFSSDMGVVIGGYAEGRRITNDQIAVTHQGTVHIFKKKELIDELKGGQLKLL